MRVRRSARRRGREFAYRADLVEPIGGPFCVLEDDCFAQIRLDLGLTLDLGSEARALEIGAQPMDNARLFLRDALLIECDQPDEQFLLGRLLILALMGAGRGAAGLADEPIADVAPAISGEYLPVDFVVQFLQDRDLARVINVALGVRQRIADPGIEFAQALQRIVEPVMVRKSWAARRSLRKPSRRSPSSARLTEVVRGKGKGSKHFVLL